MISLCYQTHNGRKGHCVPKGGRAGDLRTFDGAAVIESRKFVVSKTHNSGE